MARQKSTPLRREVSSEYTQRADTLATPSRSSRNLSRETVLANEKTGHGHIHGEGQSIVLLPTTKDAGLPQLIIAVGGIYASL